MKKALSFLTLTFSICFCVNAQKNIVLKNTFHIASAGWWDYVELSPRA